MSTAIVPGTGGHGEIYDPGDRQSGADGLANFLGWFSIGLGLAQVISPGSVNALIGAPDSDRSRTVMRMMGVREITAGVGILAKREPAEWVWARVAGDALDLALLGRTMSDDDADRGRTAGATLAVLGVTALDVFCAQQLTKTRAQRRADGVGEDEPAHDGAIRTRRSITVGRPVEEVYAFWRDFENLPRFMRHLESVRVLDERRSHWVAKAPMGQSVEWDAEIVEERENELIAWASTESADVYNAGAVHFVPAPGGRGTEVRVQIEYAPPGGVIASKIAMLFREEPGQQIQDDLRHFKQVMEIGEIVVSDATKRRGPHPAQPSEGGVEL